MVQAAAQTVYRLSLELHFKQCQIISSDLMQVTQVRRTTSLHLKLLVGEKT